MVDGGLYIGQHCHVAHGSSSRPRSTHGRGVNGGRRVVHRSALPCCSWIVFSASQHSRTRCQWWTEGCTSVSTAMLLMDRLLGLAALTDEVPMVIYDFCVSLSGRAQTVRQLVMLTVFLALAGWTVLRLVRRLIFYFVKAVIMNLLGDDKIQARSAARFVDSNRKLIHDPIFQAR